MTDTERLDWLESHMVMATPVFERTVREYPDAVERVAVSDPRFVGWTVVGGSAPLSSTVRGAIDAAVEWAGFEGGKGNNGGTR